MKRLLLSLLGPFETRLDDEDITNNFRTKKERALLAYLASHSDRPHNRDTLGELFWPDRPRGYARTNLRQALTGIRRCLGEDDTQHTHLVVSDEFIRFDLNSSYFLDTTEFKRLLAFSNQHSHQSIETCEICAEKLASAAHLYRGQFLDEFLLPDANFFQEWLIFEREYYFQKILNVLQNLIEYYQNQGEYTVAQQFAWRQVKTAPLEETAHRQLMILLASDGRRNAALEQYQVCRQILANELGVDPDIETTALYEKIKAGFLHTPLTQNTAMSATNLPAQFTVFIGREDELAWLDDCLCNSICRLVSITGLSGIGKTRIAIQAARQNLKCFPDGIWFVSLQNIHSTELIIPHINQVLGLKPSRENPKLQLVEYLAGRRVLILLDNFEQLLQGTEIILELLHQVPGIKFLITSQQRLSYQAACNIELRGLPYPQAPTSFEAAMDFAAIKLFLARANRMYSGFDIQADDMDAIIQICQTVNGLPLGIELAAASLRHHNPQQIALNLSHNMDILNTTMLDIPERHRSLRAAFDQSWGLLSPTEQDIYQRLSIFQGEFSLETANQTAGADLTTISAFVDKSLLITNSAGQYLIQPLLRQYAASKLSEQLNKNIQIEDPNAREDHPVTRTAETGLPNEQLFRDLCHYALARAQRTRKYAILIIVELSKTRAWQESQRSGQEKQLLSATAHLFSETLRDSDTLAQLKPTQFAILLEDINQPNAVEVVIKKIFNQLYAKPVFDPDDWVENLLIGYSIYPDQAKDTITLLEVALANFKHKNKGKPDHGQTDF